METSEAPKHQNDYPSIVFLTSQFSFVSDGHGLLYALDLSSDGDPLRGTFDLPVDADPALSPKSPPFRLHSVAQTSDDTAVVILSARRHGQPHPSESSFKPPPVEFDIYAAQFSLPISPASDEIVTMTIKWHRHGTSVPSFVAYDPSLKSFLLAGPSSYPTEDKPTEDMPVDSSETIVTFNETSEPSVPALAPEITLPSEDEPKLPPYAWTQELGEITLSFPLPADTDVSKISIVFSPSSVKFAHLGALADASLLLRYSGVELWDQIVPTASFWTWDAEASPKYGLLMLYLQKRNEGTRWLQVFADSPDVPEVPETVNPSELTKMLELMEKYTSGAPERGAVEFARRPSLSSVEGEADEAIDESVGRALYLTWIGEDGSTPLWVPPKGADTPFQVLSLPMPGIRPPAVSLVVRRAVDGLDYTLLTGGGAPVWAHTATYSALAFVLASKEDMRFTYHASPQAVLAFESSKGNYGGHVYIYRLAKPGELHAKQAILSLGDGSAGSVLGVGVLRSGQQPVVLCLCEQELVVMRNILN
ncbi:hypothetical protein EWM64_g2101 [Hericium alpestre]|uniref:NudC domain-containing protein 1 n=1 Tax=Hericium alpestre TaxID=135208 RepID=A0A4Z0A618_9AGAM|nr:hypothetical protein EWM64_g2101 [Hericium alpestre]